MIAIALTIASCQKSGPVTLRQSGHGSAELTSIVYTGDPDAGPQLLKGFFNIEEYSWRWTAQKFSVVLRPPDGAMGENATLDLSLAIPPYEIERLGAITLRAAIESSSLGSETYTKPGHYHFRRDVPASLLTHQEVRIDFDLDKSLKPDGDDTRDLGIIVASISLEPR